MEPQSAYSTPAAILSLSSAKAKRPYSKRKPPEILFGFKIFSPVFIKRYGVWACNFEAPADSGIKDKSKLFSVETKELASEAIRKHIIEVLLPLKEGNSATLDVLFKTAVDNFLEALGGKLLNKRPATVKGYVSLLKCHLGKFYDEPTMLKSISPVQVEKIINHAKNNNFKSKKDLSPNSIAKLIVQIRYFQKWCKQAGYLKHELVSGSIKVGDIQVGSKEVYILNENDLKAMLAKCSDIKFRLFLLIALYTGLREKTIVRSATSMRWLSVDFEKQTITIPRITQKFHKEKKRADHVVPIHPILLDALKKHKSCGALPTDFVLTNTNVPLKIYTGWWFKKILNEAGLPQTNVHSLRKSFSKLLINAGVEVFTRRKLMDKSISPDNTGDTSYVPPTFDELRVAVCKLPNLI